MSLVLNSSSPCMMAEGANVATVGIVSGVNLTDREQLGASETAGPPGARKYRTLIHGVKINLAKLS